MTGKRPWTTSEIRALRAFATLGATGVADLLERSPASVKLKAAEIRVSLVRTGEDVDLRVLPSRLLEMVRRSPHLPVCPSCGRRLAMVQSTGLCRVCHLDRLIELRQEQLEVIARGQKLAKLRQDKARLRTCEGCGSAFFPRASSTKTLCGKCGDA